MAIECRYVVLLRKADGSEVVAPMRFARLEDAKEWANKAKASPAYSEGWDNGYEIARTVRLARTMFA